MLLAIGAYTMKLGHVKGTPAEGIRIVELDEATGALHAIRTYNGIRNPSYLATSADRRLLYAVEELPDDAGPELFTFEMDRENGRLALLSRVGQPGAFGCHVCVDPAGRFVFVANFVSGDLLCYRLSPTGLPQPNPQVVRTGPMATTEASRMHCSVVMPDGKSLVVCDAGGDLVASFAIGPDRLSDAPVGRFATRAGSFPRHVALTPTGKSLLLATEHTSRLMILRPEASGMVAGSDLSSVPEDWTGTRSGAAVRVHPNGRFGYMSSRQHNSIFGVSIDEAALTLTPVGRWSTRGKTPRDFVIEPGGRWLIAGNQDSDSLTVFAIDEASGGLTFTGQVFETGSPSAVLPL